MLLLATKSPFVYKSEWYKSCQVTLYHSELRIKKTMHGKYLLSVSHTVCP